jgi:large subunit ribosomal protein L24
MAHKIKTGDIVKIIAGKDNGKTGKVLEVIPSTDRVVVEGINLRKKFTRPKNAGEKGEQVTFSAPLHISNVMLYSEKLGKAVRVGYRVDADGKKTRWHHKSQQSIDSK